MNKRFSTLLAGVLLAGSFGSAFAQLDVDAAERKVEWTKFQTGRYYYLTGIHSAANQAINVVDAADRGYKAIGAISQSAPTLNGQWTVEKSAAGLYSFIDKDGKRLAFADENADGVYEVVTKKDDANKTAALHWFKLTADEKLQLQNVDGERYLGVTKIGAKWYLSVVATTDANNHVKEDFALYEAYDQAVTPADFRDTEGDNFSFDFSGYAELQGDSTFNENDIKVVTVGTSSNNAFYLMVEGECDNEANASFNSTPSDKFKAAKFIYATKETVTNNLNDEPLTGYRYDVITGAELIKADNKIDQDNAKFYAYTSLNQKGYILKQCGVNEDANTTWVWVDKVDADNQVSYVATREVNVHKSPMVIEVGHGTRVAASEIANAKTKIVNVLAMNSNKVFAKALGLNAANANLYAKASEAMTNYPAGQWVVALGTNANTIKLINVQNNAVVDNIALYETDKAGAYKVKASGVLNGETIKFKTVENFSQENGYFHAENIEGQTYTFATTVEALVGGVNVDVYLKADNVNNAVFGTPYEERATEWTLTRAEKATDRKLPNYKYYEGTTVKESKDEVIRKDYTYTIVTENGINGIAGAYGLGATPLSFYLRQVAKDAYVIAYDQTGDSNFEHYAELAGDGTEANDYKLGMQVSLAEATRFTIEAVQPFASYPADSKWVNVSDMLGKFVSANDADAAILSKEPLKLFVDSVNAEDATPKFFLSQNGKMMVDGEFVADLAEKAFENDEITAAEQAVKIASTWYDYPTNNVRRVMFTDAARVESQDSVMLAGAEEAIETPAAFKFQILDVDGAYVLYNMNGGFVNVLNGNLVLGSFNAVEAFVIEDTEAPTANEGVEVSEVKVIAGNGQVTIAGAQGKKVVVSNILGQTVANTVVASDNATIAAPAGVVVVAVEGEAAVKAIVK
ncbi:DUF6383 domain-containing protein [Parabacteroides johnsonii]